MRVYIWNEMNKVQEIIDFLNSQGVKYKTEPSIFPNHTAFFVESDDYPDKKTTYRLKAQIAKQFGRYS